MSGLEKVGGDSFLELLDLPIGSAVATALRGLAPDMDKAAIAAMQDDTVRFYRMLSEATSRLADEIRAKVDPIEALDLASQTVANMRRTAQQEKRAQMITVCVHGILRPDDDAAEKRLFVRAVADLDLAHVALLKRADESTFYGALVVKDIQRSLLAELISRGFMQRTERKSDLRNMESLESLYSELKREREAGDRWTLYSLTALGQRFVHYLRGTVPSREPREWILKNPDPLP